MTKLYNQIELKQIRRILRKSMPKGEVILWQHLKNKQLGCRFRRQFSLSNYVLDFFSPKIKLCIEVDGLSHDNESAIKNDIEREQYLMSKGVHIIRFTSNEIFNKLPNVLESILLKIKELKKI